MEESGEEIFIRFHFIIAGNIANLSHNETKTIKENDVKSAVEEVKSGVSDQLRFSFMD